MRAELVSIGLMGKLLGPAGFLQAVRRGQLPKRFGLTIATNDVAWWPAFTFIVAESVHRRGGIAAFLFSRER